MQKGFSSLFILVLVLVGAGAYYFGKSQVPKTQSQNPVVISPTSQPTSAPDETANWKTYINNKCRYQIKYPSSWSISPEKEDVSIGATVIFPYEIGSGIKIPEDWFKVQIGCANKPANTTFQNLVKQLNSRDSGYGVSTFEQQEEISLNGYSAVKQINIPPVGDKVLEYYIFPTGDKYYTLGFTPAETKAKELLEQILSTFKLLNQEQKAVASPPITTTTVPSQSLNYPKPSSWSSYSASKIGLSLCLPPKWESDENGHIVFNRDPAYKPDVAYMKSYPYKGGSRREEFINQKVQSEYEPEKLKQETSVKELTINGLSVLDVKIPSFAESFVFVFGNKLYEVNLSSWNLVNDSEANFRKDIYTMIGCMKEI